MVVRSHLHFHEGDGELMAFPMVPVNPLAGRRERHRVKKDPNKKLEWERKETRLTTVEKPKEELATAGARNSSAAMA